MMDDVIGHKSASQSLSSTFNLNLVENGNLQHIFIFVFLSLHDMKINYKNFCNDIFILQIMPLALLDHALPLTILCLPTVHF